MKRLLMYLLCALLLSSPILADVTEYFPGTPGVGAAINSGGKFFVSNDSTGLPLFGASAYAYDGRLDAFGQNYSDAGLVIGLDGSLTLGKILGVSVAGTGSPLALNLWFDTGGDGRFFLFGGISGYELTGLNGDSYAGCGPPPAGQASNCYMFGGNGSGGTHTLANLRSGSVAGIDANTPTALWLGVTNPGGQAVGADISRITLTTTEAASPVPEPSSLVLLSGMMAGLAITSRRRRK